MVRLEVEMSTRLFFLNKSCYDIFGTFSPWRLPKDEFNRLIKKNEAEMNSQQTDK